MKYLTNSGLSYFFNKIKTYIAAQLNSKANLTHTHSASDITSGLATVATSGSYNDLSNKPTIPTVNNATLKIQKNGTDIKTFTANASSNVTCNITVPTKTSDLTNDSCIPLSGTNALAGSIVPDTDNAYDLGNSNNKFKSVKTNLLNTYQVAPNTDSESLLLNHDISYGGFLGSGLVLRGKNSSIEAGCFNLVASNGTNSVTLQGTPSGTLTWGGKNLAMQEDVVPRSGGAVITGNSLYRTTDNDSFIMGGGSAWDKGGAIFARGAGSSQPGLVIIQPAESASVIQWMYLTPDGTLTWSGQPIQYGSDQRLKQQIAEIDDKLLDAWEDVDLVQFKYNDAVEEKGTKARLHTGYVVQQIDEACQSHDVDISQYGLYCHEEYPERTEEVTIENEDGTTTKETRVIEEASEHYSLRYTETLVVECAYLRKQIKELKERLEKLEGNAK